MAEDMRQGFDFAPTESDGRTLLQEKEEFSVYDKSFDPWRHENRDDAAGAGMSESATDPGLNHFADAFDFLF